jgi:hypothetical protein
MNPLLKFLLGGAERTYLERRKLLRLARPFPRLVKKHAASAILPHSLRHMRDLDLAVSFDRGEEGLSAMRFEGTQIFESTPVDRVIPRIDRPVTLVTTGPSAMDHDWESVRRSGRMIVGVTGGATFLRERGIVPELLILSDPGFGKTGGYHIRDAQGVPLVLEYRCAAALFKYFPEALQNRPISLLERVNRWYGVPALEAADLERLNETSGSPFRLDGTAVDSRIGWSDRLDLGFFPSSTVAFVALQILVGLGAEDIEIIGMDLGGTSSIYGNARPSRLRENYESAILPCFEVMHTVLSGRKVRIRNLSKACPLPGEIFA